MAVDFPLPLTLIIVGTQIVVTLIMWFGLYRLMKNDHAAAGFRVMSVLLIGWLIVSNVLASQGFFQVFMTLPLVLGVVIAAGYGLLAFSGAFRQALDSVPQAGLIGLQFYRVLGAVFLVLMAQNRLPDVFALPAGIGDILVGLAAPLVAYAVFRGWSGARRLAIAWNLLGLADLVIALSLGFLSSPSPAQVFFTTPSPDLLTEFPAVLIPIFLVPVAILLHLFSLRRLLRQETKMVVMTPTLQSR